MYDLYSKFDIKKHKEKYVDYLEVVILENGEVQYAVPSHQEKLIKMACLKKGICREELERSCPEEYWFNYLQWLCMQSGCVAVWNTFCRYESVSTAQIVMLRKLKKEGIYFGEIPELARKK